MALTLDDVFTKEFNAAVQYSSKIFTSIELVPIPESPKTSEATFYMVKGIVPELLKPLEGTVVEYSDKVRPLARTYTRTGEISTKLEQVSIPVGSLLVISPVSVNIPYKSNDLGDGYIAVDKYSKGKFMYILPKTVLYPMNRTALTISTRKLKSYYSVSIRLSDFSVLYVSVIPYHRNVKYTQTRVLSVKTSLDYIVEINDLFSFWLDNGVMYPTELYNVGETNLSYKDLPNDYLEFSSVSSEPLKIQESLPEVTYSDSEIYSDTVPVEDDELGWA